MDPADISIIQTGAASRVESPQLLRAGPLSLLYDNGDVRYIKLGDEEIVRRVYVAVRDHNWDTIPAVLRDVEVNAGADSFEIAYTAHHRQRSVDLIWQARIRGQRDGTIAFHMDAVVRRTFLRNRIGFCVLHPMSCAGRRAVVEHTDGIQDEAVFPQQIAPQLAVDGKIRPVYPFADMRALAHELTTGGMARIAFSGEIFEMEDQRNWTDASYKTYGTPLALPFPVEVQAGSRLTQSVVLTLDGQAVPAQPEPSVVTVTEDVAGPPVEVRVGTVTASSLPRIGLGMASHGKTLTALEVVRMRALHLHHLRVDLPLWQADECRRRLASAAADARALDLHLEIALFLSDDAARELAQLRVLLDEIRPPAVRWLIFHQREKSTSAHWVDLARMHLAGYAAGARFGAGSNAYFAEINRARPDPRNLDFLTYSINPQVHAFDHASLIETPPAQAVTVASARAFAGGKSVVVSPVTLRPRFNPNATGPEPAPEPGQLPAQVDVRQMSLLGAGWTLASLKHLLGSGVEAVTYYETTGWRGVMETADGSPLPERFLSVPGGVFPLYHVFADVGEFSPGGLTHVVTSDPLRVEALALTQDGRRRVLAANMTPEEVTLSVAGLPGDVTVRRLDASNAEHAVRAPEEYRRTEPVTAHTTLGRLSLGLPPYGLVCIDSAQDDKS